MFFTRTNLITFALGTCLLIAGSVYYQQEDWDIPLSILMALSTFLTAPYAVKALRHEGFMAILGAILSWLFISGFLYIGYNTMQGNELIHGDPFIVASCLYWICGLFWFYFRNPEQLG